jgi:hypothetical protein
MNWADVFGLLICLSVMLLPFQRINNELLENSNVTKWQCFKFSPYTKVSSFDIVFLYAIIYNTIDYLLSLHVLKHDTHDFSKSFKLLQPINMP